MFSVNQTVWIKPNLSTGNTKPVSGVVSREHVGSWLSEAIFDVLLNGETISLPLSLLTAKKPKKIVKSDNYGEFTVWE